MPLKTPLDLSWRQSRRVSWPVLAMLLAGVASAMGLLAWAHHMDGQRAVRESQLRRLSASRRHPPAVPTKAPLDPAALRQMQQQIGLLNRDWASLTQALLPADKDIRLLSLDINPASSAVRIIGLAGSPVRANDYAQTLEARADTLHEVRLLLVERQGDGVRFEVGAQWNR